VDDGHEGWSGLPEDPWPWDEEVWAQRELIAKSPWGRRHPELFTAAERGESREADQATPIEGPFES